MMVSFFSLRGDEHPLGVDLLGLGTREMRNEVVLVVKGGSEAVGAPPPEIGFLARRSRASVD
jgi:hypothetical protein